MYTYINIQGLEDRLLEIVMHKEHESIAQRQVSQFLLSTYLATCDTLPVHFDVLSTYLSSTFLLTGRLAAAYCSTGDQGARLGGRDIDLSSLS